MSYLQYQRDKYNTLKANIEGIRNKALADKRDVTDEEMRSITEWNEAAAKLAPVIQALAAEEQRNAAVDAAAGSVAASVAAAAAAQAAAQGGNAGQGASGPQNRSQADSAGQGSAGAGEQQRNEGPGVPAPGTEQRTGNTTTQDRDPGHYTRNSEHSFFSDIVRAREGDGEAARRLEQHNRALSTGVAGAGIVPPVWLTQEYEALARQGRVVSAGVRRIELTNPSPLTLPRQTGGTDSVIAQQSTENTHPSETDAFATTTDVVTPKPTSGIQVVSRQMIDMTNPAVDALIYGDMLAVFNRKVEDSVTAALATAAGTAVKVFANEAAFIANNGADVANAVIDAAFAVWNARKMPATAVAMRVSRWGQFNKFRDTTGRKIYPTQDAGPMNVDGVGSVQSAGNVEGLPVLVTDGLGIGGASYPETILVYRASDTILFEGAMQRFRYEEVAGPESVKLGIWAYTAVIVRQAANSVRKITITAA